MQRLLLSSIMFFLGWVTIMAQNSPIYSHLPQTINPEAQYLFYLHGRIIETEGRRPEHPRFGVYEYDQILNTFADSGFVVISEARPPDTRVIPYARKITAQVDSLLQAGVPPTHITVVGASKGAVIAGFVSAFVQQPEVRYVLLSICSETMIERWLKNGGPFSGKVLYINELSDPLGQHCYPVRQRISGPQLQIFKEIQIHTGLHHGFLYRPLPEWVTPTIRWARGLPLELE